MRNIISSLYSSFSDYARPTPLGHVYALARTLLATSLLITLAISGKDVLFDSALFGYRTYDTFLRSINLYYLLGYEGVGIGIGFSIVTCIWVISGYFPRYSGILHWWITYSFSSMAAITEGGDQIATIIALLLVPLTLLDSRKNHWQKAKPGGYYRNFTGNLCISLVRIQMSLLYLHAATEKMYKTTEWKDGTATYYFMTDSMFGYPDWMGFFMQPLLENSFTVVLLTWGTILFELLLAGAIFMPSQRRSYLLFPALLFHGLIMVIFGLVSFFLAMAGGLVLYLLPRDRSFDVSSPGSFLEEKKKAVLSGSGV